MPNANLQRLTFVNLSSNSNFNRIDGELALFFGKQKICITFVAASSAVVPLELRTDTGAADCSESIQGRQTRGFCVAAVPSGYSDDELKLILHSNRIAANGRGDLNILSMAAEVSSSRPGLGGISSAVAYPS